MKTKILTMAFLVGIVLFVSGCTSYNTPSQAQINRSASANTIEITSSGFSPNTLTVKSGDSVTFLNRDSNDHWPASAAHPTHTIYPESGGCIGSRFDACKGLSNEESWQFKFDQKGSWKYHDHLNPWMTGTVVVE